MVVAVDVVFGAARMSDSHLLSVVVRSGEPFYLIERASESEILSLFVIGARPAKQVSIAQHAAARTREVALWTTANRWWCLPTTSGIDHDDIRATH